MCYLGESGKIVPEGFYPNPSHARQAIELLSSYGIEVVWGVACKTLNPPFSNRIQALMNKLQRLPTTTSRG